MEKKETYISLSFFRVILVYKKDDSYVSYRSWEEFRGHYGHKSCKRKMEDAILNEKVGLISEFVKAFIVNYCMSFKYNYLCPCVYHCYYLEEDGKIKYRISLSPNSFSKDFY